MAANTVIAVVPGLANRHGLSPTWAGVFCSIWWFARMGSFLGLWLWPGWHYRFRWFLAGFVLLVVSFAAVLLSPVLWPVLVAQLAFGSACGLIYYSSLYYSMNAGDTKGEHGGIHEAAIGVGMFIGPATGATALHFVPSQPQAATWAVSALLVAGLAGVVWRKWRSNT
jgi:predicted MFS family arabinose efflux permease